MNRQQILSRLARRGWEVIYDQGPLTLWERGGDRWRQAGWLPRLGESDGVVLAQPGKVLTRWPTVPVWDDIVLRAHARWLRAVARRHKCSGRLIAWVTHPSYLPLVTALRPHKVIYHVYDAYSLSRGWNEGMAQVERRLVQRADLIVAVTEAMARLLPAGAHGKTRILPNGADVAAFEKGSVLPCPRDLEQVPRPRIGYVGNITQKVDLRLLRDLAGRRPEWHWVLLGRFVRGGSDPAALEFELLWEESQKLPNVHYLGEKRHEELPAYVGHMDVNTMLYRTDGSGWWHAGYPLKLHEYLAVGKPVVSADIAAVREFGGVVTLARGAVEWEAAIQSALEEDGHKLTEKRRLVARENSWDHRVDVLESYLRDLFQ